LNKIWEYLNEPFGSAYYVSGVMLGAYLWLWGDICWI
jgi:hypothetical protein